MLASVGFLVLLAAGAAATYEQSLDATETPGFTAPVEASVAEALKKARPTAVPDARLSAACAEYLEGKVFAPVQVSGAAEFDLFRFLLWRQGVGDTVILPYRGRFQSVAKAKAAMGGVVGQLVGTPFNRWGVATRVDAKKHVDVVILVAQRDVAFTPIPRTVQPAATIETTISAATARDVRVLVQHPQGTTTEHAVGSVERAATPVTFAVGSDPGRYDVEIVFLEPSGPYITSSFPVFVGQDPPNRFVAPSHPPEAGKIPEAEIEARLAKLVNATRARYKLPPLTVDATLSRIAREHSADMRKAGFGRSSPGHPPLTRRLERADVWFRDATEIIGAGVSASAVHASLIASPAHRLVLLDARLTGLGVGVAVVKTPGAAPQVYATQVLAALVPKVDAKEARKRLLARINEKRAESGLPPLAADAKLDAAASGHAAAMARHGEPAYDVPVKGGKPVSLFDAAKAAVPGAKEIGGFVGVLETLEDPLELESVLGAEMQKAGIGVVQASSAEYGQGALWIAVVVAR